MSLCNWDEKYNIGIASIDLQHKNLFLMANRLYEAMQRGAENDILGEILVETVEHISQHFSLEESYMEQHQYPTYEQHTKEHNAIREKAMDLFDDFGKGENTLSVDVLTFLRDWLQAHILASDAQYATYLIDRGIV